MTILRYIAGSLLTFLVLTSCSVAARDNQMEQKLDRAFEAGELRGLHSVLVIHKGHILAERYYEGEDESSGTSIGARLPDATSLHDIRSVTKSITGLLYGIALSEGLVPGLDAPLIAEFPEYPELAKEPMRQKILVRHALSMKMGTKWSEDLPYTDTRNSETAMELAEDRNRYVLNRLMVSVPGDRWVYNGGATAIIARLISKGVGKPLDVYAKEKLFAPLGIEVFEWASGDDGVPLAASGLRLNIHDLAKIGQLILDDGKWEERQIVPADWLRASFTPEADLASGLRYGLFWWLAGEGEPPRWVAGFGNGGQRLMINPSDQMVFVVFAGNYNQPDAWELPVKILIDYVLPTLR